MHQLRRLLDYFRPHRRQLQLGLFAILTTAGVGLLAPLVIGQGIDALHQQVTPRRLLAYAALLVVIATVQGFFSFLQRKTLVTMSRNIELDLRRDLYSQLQRLEPAFYQHSYTGDLMARATNDLEAIRRLCGPAIMYGANTLFVATGALLFMYRIHPWLTLLSLCTLPLVVLITQFFGQRIHSLFEAVQADFSRLSAKVQESLAGSRVVRAYAQEEAEERAFDRLSRDYVESNRQLIRWNAAFRPLLQLMIGLGIVAVLYFGSHLLIDDRITVGQFVSFNLFLAKLTWPMVAVGWVINITQRGLASFGRIREILDIEPGVRDQEPLEQPKDLTGAVRFDHLDFTYPGNPQAVLRQIDFAVDAGTRVALVGRTGAGKSTLLSLIPRLYEPAKGSLWIDGFDVRRLPLATLRSMLAMVPQETFLFSATIRDNVAFGQPEASGEEIQQAVRLAGLDEDLQDFPAGLDTIVGERGISLSGGQRQRVALARAVLRQPRLLLLDDCLSAVDAQTEERILDNLRIFFPGRTVFQVSHRISAVEGADLILVLDQGRIVERGDHQELLDQGGLYADLERRQRLEDELATV